MLATRVGRKSPAKLHVPLGAFGEAPFRLGQGDR